MSSDIRAAHSPTVTTELLRFGFVLIGVQALRALAAWPLWSLLRLEDHDVRSNLISALSFLIVGAVLLVWARPSAASLGLRWSQTSRRAKIAYAAGLSVLLGMVLLSVVFDATLFQVNVHSVVITPLFEELLFRGWGWGRLEPALRGQRGGLWTLLLTTALFGLWHLGYVDHLLRVLPLHGEGMSLGVVLIWKVMIGGAVGLLAGWVRLRSGQVYGSFLVHGFWNLFGR